MATLVTLSNGHPVALVDTDDLEDVQDGMNLVTQYAEAHPELEFDAQLSLRPLRR